MANVIQGTNVSDNLVGTAGADLFIPGGGADSIFGGGGNDTIQLDAATDLAPVGGNFNQFDGGTGTNTLHTALLAGDNLTGLNTGALTDAIVWGNGNGFFANIQRVEVTNASNAILTVGTASTFVFDDAIASVYGGGATFNASGLTNIEGTEFDGAIVAAAGGVAFDADAGVMVDGKKLGDGDTFETAGGGTVVVAHDTGASDEWQFNYTSAPINTMDVVSLDAITADETKMLGMTTASGQSVMATVAFSYNFGADVDLTGNSLGVRVTGSDLAVGNTIISGSGNDTIFMNGGTNTVTLNGGDNRVWAGPGDDAANGNTVTVAGDGNNRVGTGSGDDSIDINGDGNNAIFAGAEDDTINVNGDGDNVVWAGADDDAITVNGDGNNQVAGGAGDDTFVITGDGDNTIFGGAAAGDSSIDINGDGDNLIFGGNSAAKTGSVGNTINVNGDGANEVFNGTGNDVVNINNDATVVDAADVTLHGSAGNDLFTFNTGSAGTMVFALGDGNDTVTVVTPAEFLSDNIMIDLSGIYSSAGEVFAAMNDAGVILVAPGQTIDLGTTNAGIDKTVLFANVDDWLIV